MGQINPESITNIFKRRWTERLIDSGQVVAIGSDVHTKIELDYKKYVKTIRILKDRNNTLQFRMKNLLNIE